MPALASAHASNGPLLAVPQLRPKHLKSVPGPKAVKPVLIEEPRVEN